MGNFCLFFPLIWIVSVEYMPHFYSDVEIPDSIGLVKSLQEDFKIFISEQEINEQEREELLKLGLEYLYT